MIAFAIGSGIYLGMNFISARIEKNMHRLQTESPAAQWGTLIGHLSATLGVIYLIGRGVLAVIS